MTDDVLLIADPTSMKLQMSPEFLTSIDSALPANNVDMACEYSMPEVTVKASPIRTRELPDACLQRRAQSIIREQSQGLLLAMSLRGGHTLAKTHHR